MGCFPLAIFSQLLPLQALSLCIVVSRQTSMACSQSDFYWLEGLAMDHRVKSVKCFQSVVPAPYFHWSKPEVGSQCLDFELSRSPFSAIRECLRCARASRFLEPR